MTKWRVSLTDACLNAKLSAYVLCSDRPWGWKGASYRGSSLRRHRRNRLRAGYKYAHQYPHQHAYGHENTHHYEHAHDYAYEDQYTDSGSRNQHARSGHP